MWKYKNFVYFLWCFLCLDFLCLDSCLRLRALCVSSLGTGPMVVVRSTSDSKSELSNTLHQQHNVIQIHTKPESWGPPTVSWCPEKHLYNRLDCPADYSIAAREWTHQPAGDSTLAQECLHGQHAAVWPSWLVWLSLDVEEYHDLDMATFDRSQ